MSFVNFETRTIDFKIVYYGPPMGGKTTNLISLQRTMPAEAKGKLSMLSTGQDRTLYFDFLPLKSKAIEGYTSRFQIYTVPGQPIYDKTRRIVLTGVDGIVFVADSQWDMMPLNVDSLENMKANIKSHGRTLEEIQYVLQLNKRDVENIAPANYMEFLLNTETARPPCIEAVATEDKGVGDCLNMICKMVMAQFIETNKMAINKPR